MRGLAAQAAKIGVPTLISKHLFTHNVIRLFRIDLARLIEEKIIIARLKKLRYSPSTFCKVL